MKKILTLTDFSEVSNYAVEAALEFAKQHNADLEILHVLKDTDHIQYELDSDPELFIRTKSGDVRSSNLGMWRSKALSAGVITNMIISAGEMIQRIQEIIEEHEIDMVVMGSTGIDESNKYWGTATQEVVRRISIPILVIKSRMKDYRMDNLVFVSDLELQDQKSFQNALTLLNPSDDATIHLMSVNTSSFFSQPSVLMKSALSDFEKLAQPYSVSKTFYRDYSIDAGIKHFVSEVKPDVLIMSNRERNPFKEFFSPSAAVTAVGKATCPVLILK